MGLKRFCKTWIFGRPTRLPQDLPGYLLLDVRRPDAANRSSSEVERNRGRSLRDLRRLRWGSAVSKQRATPASFEVVLLPTALVLVIGVLTGLKRLMLRMALGDDTHPLPLVNGALLAGVFLTNHTQKAGS